MLHVKSTTYYIHKMQNYGVTFKVSIFILLFYYFLVRNMPWGHGKIMFKKEKNWECKTVTCFCFFYVISLFELDLLHVDGKIFFFTLNDCVFFCSTFKDSRKHRLEAWTEARLLYFESYVCSWSSQYQYSSELIISNF